MKFRDLSGPAAGSPRVAYQPGAVAGRRGSGGAVMGEIDDRAVYRNRD